MLFGRERKLFGLRSLNLVRPKGVSTFWDSLPLNVDQRGWHIMFPFCDSPLSLFDSLKSRDDLNRRPHPSQGNRNCCITTTFWLHNHLITIIYGKRQGESSLGKPSVLTSFYDNDTYHLILYNSLLCLQVPL